MLHACMGSPLVADTQFTLCQGMFPPELSNGHCLMRDICLAWQRVAGFDAISGCKHCAVPACPDLCGTLMAGGMPSTAAYALSKSLPDLQAHAAGILKLIPAPCRCPISAHRNNCHRHLQAALARSSSHSLPRASPPLQLWAWAPQVPWPLSQDKDTAAAWSVPLSARATLLPAPPSAKATRLAATPASSSQP